MKHRSVALCIIVLLGMLRPVSGQERRSMKVVFTVVDDVRKPVENAEVTASVFSHWLGGEGFGKDVNTITQGLTTREGLYELEATSSRGDFACNVAKQGHYGLRGVRFNFAGAPGGRWEPWGASVPIELKRVLDPIPLMAKVVVPRPGDYTAMPADKAAYDMELGDWTAPHGLGRHGDLVFELDGRAARLDAAYETTLRISFSNSADGVVIVDSSKDQPSELKMPYGAPLEGYQPAKAWKKSRVKGPATGLPYTADKLSDDFKAGENYFLRVRTQMDDEGRIISAHYAKVQGGFLWWPTGLIKFQYHFNPKANDRNLEFDPLKNLLPTLLPGQEVSEP
ncbi:MAG: hypothetical protein ACO1TE_14545 [Prosthecobacter sp.]